MKIYKLISDAYKLQSRHYIQAHMFVASLSFAGVAGAAAAGAAAE